MNDCGSFSSRSINSTLVHRLSIGVFLFGDFSKPKAFTKSFCAIPWRALVYFHRAHIKLVKYEMREFSCQNRIVFFILNIRAAALDPRLR